MLSEEQNPDSELLELVNKARVILEMPPLARLPKGIPDTSRKCVLGRSLGVEVLLDDQDRAYALVFAYRLAHRLARAWGVGRPYGMWNGWAVLLPSELDVIESHFADQAYDHVLACGLGHPHISSAGLDGAPHPAEDIQLPRRIEPR